MRYIFGIKRQLMSSGIDEQLPALRNEVTANCLSPRCGTVSILPPTKCLTDQNDMQTCAVHAVKRSLTCRLTLSTLSLKLV